MTNILLIFFAFPIATIIISIAIQKILRSPILVAAVIFAIFLIVTFAAFDATFLIATIIYTIIAYIIAVLTCIISKIIRKIINCNFDRNITINSIENNSNNLSDTLSENDETGSNHCQHNNNTQNVLFSANVTPNTLTNGRTGRFNGCYRRRFN